jgi:hypothetical protein
MQKAGKQAGKRSGIVPLVTVTEGIRPIGTHRNATVEPVSFVDEDFNTKRLSEQELEGDRESVQERHAGKLHRRTGQSYPVEAVQS